jgi:hypothetical protein
MMQSMNQLPALERKAGKEPRQMPNGVVESLASEECLMPGFMENGKPPEPVRSTKLPDKLRLKGTKPVP